MSRPNLVIQPVSFGVFTLARNLGSFATLQLCHQNGQIVRSFSHTLKRTRAGWPFRGAVLCVVRRCHNGHFWNLSKTLGLHACPRGWVGESVLMFATQKALIHTITPGSNDSHTHTHTGWITPPLNRSCHNITLLIHRVEAACKAPVSCINLPVEQLQVCTL